MSATYGHHISDSTIISFDFYPSNEDRKEPFLTVDLVDLDGRLDTNLFFRDPADLDRLIATATEARDWLISQQAPVSAEASA